jgi:[ribosomal protein S18]-alanine N-acetyltransferase
MAPDAHPAKSPDFLIRPFEASDAAFAVALSRAAPEAALWSESSYRLTLDSGSCGWVAFERDGFAAFLIARCVADEAEILNLAVVPQFRRRRLATALLNAALTQFRNRRVRRVFLEVRESNIPAIRLYEKLGFAVSSRRPSYYSTPPEAAVCMSLSL